MEDGTKEAEEKEIIRHQEREEMRRPKKAKKEPVELKTSDGLTADIREAYQAVIDVVDARQMEAERVWGVQRLVNSCFDLDLKEAFKRQMKKFNDVVWSEADKKAIQIQGKGVVLGINALEASARGAGLEPLAAGREIETQLSDGSILVIVPDASQYIQKKDDKRALTVVGADVLGAMFEESNRVITEATRQFKGCRVEISKTRLNETPNDELPF